MSRLGLGMTFHSAKSVVFVLALVAGTGVAVFGQSSDQTGLAAVQSNGIGTRGAPNPFSLLDFSKVRWSHSYSVAFFSGGSTSGSAGLFSTAMMYEFSPKLSLTLNIGIAHTGALWSEDSRESTLLPGFSLDYHPSDKFRLTFMVQRCSGVYNPFTYRSSAWPQRLGP